MGLDVNRFLGGTVDEELLCPICSGVLENPVQVKSCYWTLNYCLLKVANSQALRTTVIDTVKLGCNKLGY